MKSWVHMVNEGRYFSDVEENCVDEEQVYEEKKGKVSLTDIAIGNAVDQIKDYFSKGAKVSKKTDEAMSVADIMAGKAGQIQWKVGKLIVRPGKTLRMGTAFLGEKGPVGTVEVKREGEKDFKEITINGNGPEGDSNIKLTNAEVEKSLKALDKKFGSKKEPKGIDGIIQAVREKLGDSSTDWFYYDSSKDDDDFDDADDGKSDWQKKSEQNADDSGQGDDERMDDINDYANSKSDGGAGANSMTNF